MTETPSWVVDHTKLCTADDPVPCELHCPLNLNIKTMLARISRGEFDSARAQYEQDVPLPGIVCRICSQPCELACARNELGGSISIRALELACMTYGTVRKLRFTKHRKKQKLLIIGGGICGMTAAYWMSKKGYAVELVSKDPKLGGALWNTSREVLPANVIDEAIESVSELASIELESTVGSPSDREWDACLVVTGLGGECFDLNCENGKVKVDPITFETSQKHIFAAGGVIGEQDPVVSMSQAIEACRSIDRFFRGGSLYIDRETVECSRLNINLEGVEPCKRIESDEPIGMLTEEKAVAEASRCIQCECDFCVRTCDLMSRDNRKPKRCIGDLAETYSAVAKHTAKIALRKMNMCSLCNLCSSRCPTGLDMGELYLESRRIMRDRGELPPAFHDSWLRDMDHALSEKASCVVTPDGVEKVDYLYFPGCSLGASDPSLVIGAYEMLGDVLGKESVGIDVSCCGAPARWAGDEGLFDIVNSNTRDKWESLGKPVVITSCPTCRKMLAPANPDFEIVSFWEIMANQELPQSCACSGSTESAGSPDSTSSARGISPGGSSAGCTDSPGGAKREISLFDPCSARYDDAARASVRTLLQRMGYEVEQMSGDGSQARCCGFGGLIYSVDQDYAREITSKRLESAHHNVVTYCSNCRDVFASQGSTAFHMLDLMLGRTEPPARPSLGQRRENREVLKAQLVGQLVGLEVGSETGTEQISEPAESLREDINVVLDSGVLEKMDEQLILKDELVQAIESSFETGEQLLDESTGWTITHLQIGVITLWVMFEQTGDRAFAVHNIYSHRMQVG